MRDLEAAASAGNDDARLAMDTYFYGVKKYILVHISPRLEGSMSLHSPAALAKKALPLGLLSVNGLEWCGIRLDPDKNKCHTGEGEISTGRQPRKDSCCPDK